MIVIAAIVQFIMAALNLGLAVMAVYRGSYWVAVISFGAFIFCSQGFWHVLSKGE